MTHYWRRGEGIRGILPRYCVPRNFSLQQNQRLQGTKNFQIILPLPIRKVIHCGQQILKKIHIERGPYLELKGDPYQVERGPRICIFQGFLKDLFCSPQTNLKTIAQLVHFTSKIQAFFFMKFVVSVVRGLQMLVFVEAR